MDGGGDVCFRRKLGSRWAQSQGEKRNKLELSVKYFLLDVKALEEGLDCV